MLRRSNRDDVQPEIYNTKDLNKQPCNEKNQKTVMHDKDNCSVSNDEHDSNNPFASEKKKDPSEQTYDEWREEYDNA